MLPVNISEDAPLDCIIYGPQEDGFRALAGEWNQLLAQSRVDSFFMTYAWQTTWWELLGEGELWILAFRNPRNGELVGIAPLYRLSHQSGEWAGLNTLHIVGCIEVSDFLDLIIKREWEPAVYMALHRWLESDQAPDWDILDLCNLPEESCTHSCLPGLWQRTGYRLEVFQEDVAPRIHLPAHFEDYLLHQVEKKQRHEIRRKQRRVERESEAGFYLVDPSIPDPELKREIDSFVALQRMSRPDKEEFMTPEMAQFFQKMARRMLDAGYLRLAFLTMDGRRAATLFAFEYKGALLLYNSGYDTGDLAMYSPGWVLLTYLIQYSIATGMRLFDFLQGDEEYKYRFGSVDYRVMRVIVHREAV